MVDFRRQRDREVVLVWVWHLRLAANIMRMLIIPAGWITTLLGLVSLLALTGELAEFGLIAGGLFIVGGLAAVMLGYFMSSIGQVVAATAEYVTSDHDQSTGTALHE